MMGIKIVVWSHGTEKLDVPHRLNDALPSWYNSFLFPGAFMENINESSAVVSAQTYQINDQVWGMVNTLRSPLDQSLSCLIHSHSLRITLDANSEWIQGKVLVKKYKWKYSPPLKINSFRRIDNTDGKAAVRIYFIWECKLHCGNSIVPLSVI